MSDLADIEKRLAFLLLVICTRTENLRPLLNLRAPWPLPGDKKIYVKKLFTPLHDRVSGAPCDMNLFAMDTLKAKFA